MIECEDCAGMVRKYGGGQCDACWDRDNPNGIRFSMTMADVNPDALRVLFGMDPREEGQP